MSLGMSADWEQRLNKAFAYILKASPNFTFAQNKYRKLKCKDLTKSVCEHDILLKVDAINNFQQLTKIDLLSKKAQKKRMKEQLSIYTK